MGLKFLSGFTTYLEHWKNFLTSLLCIFVLQQDVCSKLDLAMHHNSRLLDKYVTSSQQTPKLSQKEGLNDLAKIIHLTVQQARKFGTQDVLPPLYSRTGPKKVFIQAPRPRYIISVDTTTFHLIILVVLHLT